MRLSGSIATLLLAFAAGAVAAEKYAGPDDTATQAAARAALGSAKILDIVGMTRGIESALKDLGAKVTDREIRIELAADVLFDFDKSELRKEARPQLEKVASVLKAYPNATARIEGHTDGKGDAAYNQALSERRAGAVRKWLEGEGVKIRMSSKGWGKSKPVAPNTRPDGKDDPEGRQKNRRVEITLDR